MSSKCVNCNCEAYPDCIYKDESCYECVEASCGVHLKLENGHGLHDVYDWWIQCATCSEYYDPEDEHECEMKPDEYYYGKLTKPVTNVKELIRMMAKGIIKLRNETKQSKDINGDAVGDILDRWFEHDSDRDDYFDHLVPEHEFETFIKEVNDYIAKPKPKFKIPKPVKQSH